LWMGPLNPPRTAPGNLLTVAGQSSECVDVLVAAFG